MMMKMNGCRRAMCTVSCTVMLAAFMVAFHTAPVYAAQIGVQDDAAMTYTITVGEGETVALSAEDADALNSLAEGYTFIKDGPGTLLVSNQIAGFARPIVITNGIYEATSSDALGVGGDGAETYVRTGATLSICRDTSLGTNVKFKYHEKISLAGSGLGGIGALRNSRNEDATGLLDNNGYLVLDDDATIKGYSIGFKGNTAYLNGHTLTVNLDSSSKAFNLTFSNIASAGDIHAMRGRFFFDGSTTYAGGSENTVTVDTGVYFAFRETTKPIPWSLVLADGVNLYPSAPQRDGGYSNNVWSGPVTLNGMVLVYYDRYPSSVAFTGPVSGSGGFTVCATNVLHLSCPSNTFRGGVRVAGSSEPCTLTLDGGNALPPDGGDLIVRNGRVLLGAGVSALPTIRSETAGSAIISNTVPHAVVETPFLVKDGEGRISVYGGVAITNTLSVNTGKVALVNVAVDADNAPGLYKYSASFADATTLTNYYKTNIDLTFTKNLSASNLRAVFKDVVKKNEPTEVTDVDLAFRDWSSSDKFSMYAYTGYFRNMESTNVTVTFALSIWDVEALWIDDQNLIARSGTRTVKVPNQGDKTY